MLAPYAGTTRPIRAPGHAWTASIPAPSAGQVSLRVSVPGLVDQTVIGAFTVGEG
ncbi:hypothetical protein ACQEU6_29530 [Spirillospora sp. CA-108201]